MSQRHFQLAVGTAKKKVSYRILSCLRNPKWKLVLDITYTSSKKRAQFGINAWDDPSAGQENRHSDIFRLSDGMTKKKIVVQNLVTLAQPERETGPGHDVYVVRETSTDESTHWMIHRQLDDRVTTVS